MLSNEESSVAENWAYATRQLYDLSHEDAANWLKIFVDVWNTLVEKERSQRSSCHAGRSISKL
jgi:hypothetical protein